MDGNGTTWPTLNDVLMECPYLQHLWWMVMVQPDLPWMMYWWNAPFFSTSDGSSRFFVNMNSTFCISLHVTLYVYVILLISSAFILSPESYNIHVPCTCRQRLGDIKHTTHFINTVWNKNSFQILYICPQQIYACRITFVPSNVKIHSIVERI